VTYLNTNTIAMKSALGNQCSNYSKTARGSSDVSGRTETRQLYMALRGDPPRVQPTKIRPFEIESIKFWRRGEGQCPSHRGIEDFSIPLWEGQCPSSPKFYTFDLERPYFCRLLNTKVFLHR